MVYVSIVVQENNQVADGVFQTFPYEPTVVFEIVCVFLLREFDRTQALQLFRDVLASGGRTYLQPQNNDPSGDWILDCDELKATYPNSEQLQEVRWLTGRVVLIPEYEFVPTGDPRGRGTHVTFTVILPTEAH
jgi:hypothetical protein